MGYNVYVDIYTNPITLKSFIVVHCAVGLNLNIDKNTWFETNLPIFFDKG